MGGSHYAAFMLSNGHLIIILDDDKTAHYTLTDVNFNMLREEQLGRQNADIDTLAGHIAKMYRQDVVTREPFFHTMEMYADSNYAV